jgi:hypothetical protein
MKHEQGMIQGIRRGARGERWCLGIVVAISSAACAPSPDPAHQTVEYYRANREARETKVAECVNDPGALGKTPDCVNAKQAAQLEDIGSLRDLPPMGLTPESKKTDSSRSADAVGNSSNAADEQPPR